MESLLANLKTMPFTDRIALTGAILFGMGLVLGVAIGSFTTMASLTQGGARCPANLVWCCGTAIKG